MTQKRGAQIISLREAGARVRAHRRSVAEELKRPIAPDPRRSALIQLIFVLLLVGGGLLLVHVLRNVSHLQDCVMAGRTNCAPIDAKAQSD